MFNNNHAHRALDKNPETCAITGWETIGMWWKVDLGSRKTVIGVTLTGTYGMIYKQTMCVFNRTTSKGIKQIYDERTTIVNQR